MKKIILIVVLFILTAGIASANINNLQTHNVYVDQNDTLHFNFTSGGEYTLSLLDGADIVDSWIFNNAKTDINYQINYTRKFQKCEYRNLQFVLTTYKSDGTYINTNIGNTFNVNLGIIYFLPLPEFNYLRDSEIMIYAENPYLKYNVYRINIDTLELQKKTTNLYSVFVDKVNPIHFLIKYDTLIIVKSTDSPILFNGIDSVCKRKDSELTELRKYETDLKILFNAISIPNKYWDSELANKTMITSEGDSVKCNILAHANYVNDLVEYYKTMIDTLSRDTILSVTVNIDGTPTGVPDYPHYLNKFTSLTLLDNIIVGLPDEYKNITFTYKIYDYSGQLIYPMDSETDIWYSGEYNIHCNAELNKNTMYLLVIYSNDKPRTEWFKLLVK